MLEKVVCWLLLLSCISGVIDNAFGILRRGGFFPSIAGLAKCGLIIYFAVMFLFVSHELVTTVAYLGIAFSVIQVLLVLVCPTKLRFKLTSSLESTLDIIFLIVIL